MSAGKMMCFDLIFYFKKKKKSAHIGPIQVMFQTESKIYIYILSMDMRAATSTAAQCIHASRTRVCWPNRRTHAYQVYRQQNWALHKEQFYPDTSFRWNHSHIWLI